MQGCRHDVVGGIVNGNFTRLPDLSHGKPVYKRDAQVNGLDVHVYFWDDRDGPRFNGWYFGMKVGGDEVWAFHPGKESPLPPTSGWQVPFDGPVDNSFSVAARAATSQKREEPAVDAYGQPVQGQQPAAQAQAPPQQVAQHYHMPQQAQQQQQMLQQHWDAAQQWQQYQLMQQQHMMQWQAAQQQQQQHQMMEQKKRADDERRRQFDEAKRKKDEENKRRLDELIKRAEEDKAVKVVMPIIQKVRVATPESFPALKGELEDVLEKEKARAGNQFTRLRMEADKALDAAAKCIEMIMARRRLVEEKRAAEEKRRRELDEAAKALVEELRDLVERAEVQAQRLAAAAAPLEANEALLLRPPDAPQSDKGDGATADVEMTVAGAGIALSSEELMAACERVESAGAEAETMTRACTAFVLQKGPEMKRLVPMTLGADPSDISQTLAKLLQHIRDLAIMSEKTLAKARGTKERTARRILAEARSQEVDALFAKYDRDSDGVLSRKEVQGYAKGEFDFLVTAEVLDRIWKTVVEEGAKGVPRSSFHWLKVAIGTAREIARDRVRAVVREEKEQVLEEVKEVLQEKLKEVAGAVNDADKFVAKVEKQVQPLLARVKNMPVPDMVALADRTDVMIREAREIAAQVCQQLDGVSEGTSERFQQDVRAYAALEAKPLHLHMRRMEARLDRATNLSRRFRDMALQKRAAEFQKLRIAALRILRHNQRLRRLLDDEVFPGDPVRADDFVAFFAAASKEVDLVAEEAAAAAAAAAEAAEAQAAQADAAAASGEALMLDGQCLDPQQEAEQWLASELLMGPAAGVDGRGLTDEDMSASLEAQTAGLVAPMGEELGTTPAQEINPADVPVPMDAEDPLQVDPEPMVETVELSEKDAARLFSFLDEEETGLVSKEVIFKRLASC